MTKYPWSKWSQWLDSGYIRQMTVVRGYLILITVTGGSLRQFLYPLRHNKSQVEDCAKPETNGQRIRRRSWWWRRWRSSGRNRRKNQRHIRTWRKIRPNRRKTKYRYKHTDGKISGQNLQPKRRRSSKNFYNPIRYCSMPYTGKFWGWWFI